MLIHSGRAPSKKFEFDEDVDFGSGVIVVTGSNGSGKTRLLESVASGELKVSVNGDALELYQVRMLDYSKLIPSFGQDYDYKSDLMRDAAVAQIFETYREPIVSGSYDNGNQLLVKSSMFGVAVSGGEVLRACSYASTVLQIPRSELASSDILLHLQAPPHNSLGVGSLSDIYLRYIKRVKYNDHLRYKADKGKKDIRFLSEGEFLHLYGVGPWEAFNSILADLFDNKFTCNSPDPESEGHYFTPVLSDSRTGVDINIDSLSTGEKITLWLVLAMFRAEESRTDSSGIPKLLILDEPDAFLHPSMVVKMYRCLNELVRVYGVDIVITTHSPTTVALAPNDRIAIMSDDSIRFVDKDEALNNLLDGVSQIAIDPRNRREVFVESFEDVQIYTSLYQKLKQIDALSSKVSLSFLPSGSKLPEQQAIDIFKSVVPEVSQERVTEFVRKIQGVGDCGQVKGVVEALERKGSRTVRGVIDWDGKNKSGGNVAVLAQDKAYTMENLLLDPLVLMHRLSFMPEYKLEVFAGKNLSRDEWLADRKLLQESINNFVSSIVGGPGDKFVELKYVSGEAFQVDARYVTMKGHELARLFLDKYKPVCGELKGLSINQFALRSMIEYLDGKYIPLPFLDVFTDLQA